MQGAIVNDELVLGVKIQADAKSLDEREQTKLIGVLERYRPYVFAVLPGIGGVVSGEGVMKMWYSSDVPRITRHGTRE